MISYKEFVEDAISNYGSLPLESNNLYKRYYIDVPLDFTPENADINAHIKAVEAAAQGIRERTLLKFDAIISDHYAKSFNEEIRIINAQDIDPKMLSSKLFGSKEDRLAAFVNANAKHFIVIDIKENVTKKINILLINEEKLSVQVIINAGNGSHAELVEIHSSISDKKGLVTTLHEVTAQNNSEVEIDIIHDEGKNTDIIGLCKAIANDDSKIRANFVYNGGLLTKSKTIIASSGTNSQVDVSEIAYGTADQRFDMSTSLANLRPRSIARLDSGTVLDGKSQCMLKGYAKVEKGTKGCLSRITERGILLSKDAHVDALPDMSIDYSNEVKATHSASTAPIDPEALFYLESRGLEEARARKIFITAFMAKYLSNMKNGIAIQIAMSIMLEKLERGTFGEIPDIATKGVWIAAK